MSVSRSIAGDAGRGAGARSRRARALLVALLCARVAHGAETEPGGGAPPAVAPAVESVASNVVDITVVGDEQALARIRDAIGVAELPSAEVRWRRAARFDRRELLAQASDPALRVRAFVVLEGARASLYFADGRAERFLVRDVPLPSGLDAVGADAVSQVLTLSIHALTEDGEASLTRAQTEELLAPAPAPVSAPPPVAADAVPAEPREGTRSFVGATAFWEARVFGGGAPLEHGPGLRIGWVTEAPSLDGELFASARYGLPQRYETASVGVKWSTWVLRGGVAALFPIGDGASVKLGPALAAGADFVTFAPRAGAGPADVELAPPGDTLLFALSLKFVASARLGSHAVASAELFCDGYPMRVSYALSSDDGSVEDVLVPWRLRPGLALALTLR